MPTIQKILATLGLAFLTILTAQCPCKRLLCCHLGTFWLGLSFVLGVVFYENGFKLVDPSCYSTAAAAAAII